MANICETHYSVVGSKKDCERAAKCVAAIIEEADADFRYLNAFVGHPGLSGIQDVTDTLEKFYKERATIRPASNPLPYYSCGSVVDYPSVKQHSGDVYRMDFACEDCWQPAASAIKAFAKNFNLTANWMAFECGLGVCEKHDPSGVFKDYKWYLDCFTAPSDFITVSDLKSEDTFPAAFWEYLDNNNVTLTEDNLESVVEAFTDSIRQPDDIDGDDAIYVWPLTEA